MAKRKKSQGPLVQRALAFYSLPWVSRNRSEMHQSAARPTSAKITRLKALSCPPHRAATKSNWNRPMLP